MSKPKALLKQSKQTKKARRQIPETADEYLIAGVDLEEAGEKWRAGDAAKALRFFLKAIAVYDEGLSKFPSSMDLAYNKARLQYESATHPLLVSQSRVPVINALGIALESHRVALHLDENNTDTLFNTGELLTEIAEKIAEDDQYADSDALPLLKEAIELLQQCFELQQSQCLQFKQDIHIAMSNNQRSETPSQDNQNQSTSKESNSIVEEQQWVSIVEPVTEDSLIDTVLAQLGTLTTFCSILSRGPMLDHLSMLKWIGKSSTELLMRKLPAYNDVTARQADISLGVMQFKSAFLEASFRSAIIDAATYQSELSNILDSARSEEKSYALLTAYADGLMSFISAVGESRRQDPSIPSLGEWEALAAAIASLTKASQIPGLSSHDVVATHSKRGDLSLLQYQLGKPPTSVAKAEANASLLLKNACTFYRNASNLTPDKISQPRDMGKHLIVQALQQEEMPPSTRDTVTQVSFLEELIVDMVNDQLLDDQDVELIHRRFKMTIS